MTKKQNSRAVAVAALLTLALAGCAHRTAQVQDGFTPFSSLRNQAVALVASAKRTLDAADVNTLAVAYTNLEEKANAYAGFMVEAVTTSSFDSGRNAKYASDLAGAIAVFDKSFAALVTVRQPVVTAAWVPSFAQELASRWKQYGGLIAKMSPQQKASLIADLKRKTVWPNYEDIATEPLASTQ
jgi:hypothetical protein